MEIAAFFVGLGLISCLDIDALDLDHGAYNRLSVHPFHIPFNRSDLGE